MRPGKRRTLDKSNAADAMLDEAEKLKASVRTKVEHPFRVIKRQLSIPVTFTGMSVTIPESPVTLDRNTHQTQKSPQHTVDSEYWLGNAPPHGGASGRRSVAFAARPDQVVRAILGFDQPGAGLGASDSGFAVFDRHYGRLKTG